MQPPLSYYTSILNSREWNRVDIVTYADSRGSENIVIPGLRVLIETGSWPRTNITIHTASRCCPLLPPRTDLLLRGMKRHVFPAFCGRLFCWLVCVMACG